MQNPAQFGNLLTSAVETTLITAKRRCKACVVFLCLVDVVNAAIRDGCAGYPVSAFTKTAGLITDIRQLVGSRTSGND
jgi:hypothetical protein